MFILGQHGEVITGGYVGTPLQHPLAPGDQGLLRELEEQERRELYQSVEGEGDAVRKPKEWLRMAEVQQWRRTGGHSCFANSYDGQ